MEQKRYSNAVFLVTCVFSVLVSFSAGSVIYFQHIAFVESSVEKTLNRASLMIEAQCPLLNDPWEIKSLLLQNSPDYWEIQQIFSKLQQSMGVSYVYILVKQDHKGKSINENWYFLVSSFYKKEITESMAERMGTSLSEVIMSEYIPFSSDRELNRTWTDQVQTYFNASDKWGNFMSTLRPVVVDGETKCLIGAEFDLAYVQSLKRPALIALIVSLAAAIAFSVMIAAKLRQSVLRLEIGVMERTKELAEQTRLAQSASEAKSRFLASMSHEIRTPMNAIIGMSELMPLVNLNATQKQYFNGIKKMSHSLLQIINEILDVSKIESGKMDLVPVDYDIGVLYENICSIGKFSAGRKSLDFRNSFSKSLPRILYGDDTRVRQIVTNLLNNAIKYTREGFVKLSFSDEHIGERDMLVITVEDSGIGIEKENIPRLFLQFQQFDVMQNRGIIGTGLGLSIAKELATMMDGEIFVESVYGCGSTFTVKLPIVKGNPLNIFKEESKKIFAAKDTRVLVVDDNSMNCTVAIGFLATHRIYPDTAESGAEAIEKIKDIKYDIVFMDHMMPEMDGTVACEIVRNLDGEYFQKLPIIALSANAIEGAKDIFLSSGMNDFIPKPIEEQELNRVLAKWLPPEKITSGDDTDNIEAARQAKLEAFELLPLFDDLLEVSWLDVDAGLAHSGGRRKGYVAILKQFCTEAEKDIAAITEFLKNQNLKEYCTRVHALKSSLANIGATNLSARAKSLEDASRDSKQAYCVGRTEGLCADVQQLKDQIADIIQHHEKHNAKPDAEKQSIDQIALGKLLTALREACIKGDSKIAEDISAGLLLVKLGGGNPSAAEIETNLKLSEIRAAIDAFDYDIVIQKIDAVFNNSFNN
ncbi:MAG: hypothetical protein Ta2F_00480 [Termitinemataceae bacterium]|nr:MAG: hypothetical protein Ta2F_00480 [Termitinemataceae bacterium]